MMTGGLSPKYSFPGIKRIAAKIFKRAFIPRFYFLGEDNKGY